MSRILYIAIGIIIIIMIISGIIIYPFTNPQIIRTKVGFLGHRFVYKQLSYHDDLWDTVLNGVKSTDSIWLHVAVDLYPSLDTHPGEEMDGAVATVIDKNPKRAISILLPTYGAETVCGHKEDWEPITSIEAKKRLQLLSSIAFSANEENVLESCRNILKLKSINRHEEINKNQKEM